MKKALNNKTVEAKINIVKQLAKKDSTRVEIGDAIGIPTTKKVAIMHKYLQALMEQRFIDRRMSNPSTGKPGTINNPYVYFLTENARPILLFIGLLKY